MLHELPPHKETPPTELLSPQAIKDLRVHLNRETNNSEKVMNLTDEEVSHIGRFLLEVTVQGMYTRMNTDLQKERKCPPFSETEPPYAVLVPEKLKAARELRQLSQIAVAHAIGHKSNNRISRWEGGKALPDKENMKKLEAFFKVSLC